MLKKSLISVLLLMLVVLGTGCGLLADESKTDRKETKEKKEPKVAKITFGDYPSDDDVKGLLRTRSHFGNEEDIALKFDLPKGQTFDTKYIKAKVLKEPGDKLIEEFTNDVDPSWDGLKWEFTSNDDFNGFYDLGKYKIQIFRGEELLAEGKLEIVDQ
ncbi:hypothetical protein [Melghirimyces algeriensis]|uniref:Lipoprotein n=1 Tax=Melghirimyces algeriensis TaxID=910412 RepID=A0A521FE86_9BACL|nr:hypothetical protein [Melghirimyces algeriensis]SMO94473.1 hypothetical protein SAMN06264849_11736 [Melghirimyces algeriensis]